MSFGSRVEVEPGFLFGGRYRAVRFLGGGGAGDVFLVDDLVLDKQRACKVLFDSALYSHPQLNAALSPPRALRNRFLQEGRLMADLMHPNLVSVYAVDTQHIGEQEHVWLLMEYASGGNVVEGLAANGREPGVVVSILLQVLEGLQYAHANGVIHRDLKPRNILVSGDGRYMLTDFGLAKDLGAPLDLTLTGDELGSMGFVAPEQLADPRSASIQSDLYSAGATLLALLTNPLRPPLDVLAPNNLVARFPGVPSSLLAVVERACQASPSRRFRSAADLQAALRQAWPA